MKGRPLPKQPALCRFHGVKDKTPVRLRMQNNSASPSHQSYLDLRKYATRIIFRIASIEMRYPRIH